MKRQLICFAMLCSPLVVWGGTFYQPSYTLDLTGMSQPVTNILAQEFPGSSFAQRLNFLGPASGIAAADAITTVDEPFLNGSGTPSTTSLLMGIVQDLPGDAPGQKHIVLFMNPAAAALANGVAWGTLFPTVDEDQLIANLELGTSGGLNWGTDFLTLAPGLSAAADFMSSLDVSGDPGGLPGPGGTFVSPYFDLPAPGDAATNFVAVAFSDGQVYGGGTAVTNAITFPDAVPEPSFFAPCGLLVLAAAMKRRQRRNTLTTTSPTR
jgi:hypothetical protein